MELTFLGRGAAFYPAFGNTNAFFLSGGDLFFLDFGESAFEKAVRLIDMRAPERIYVILTHLHADHAGSLASLCSYTHCVLHREITVVHPVDTVKELLRLQGISPTFYHYLPSLPADCSVQAEPVEVAHAVDMRCFGYFLTDGEGTVYYSGDSGEFPARVAEALKQGRLQAVYHDTATHESASHCYVGLLEKAVAPCDRSKVYCMHLDSDCADDLTARGFRVVSVEA